MNELPLLTASELVALLAKRKLGAVELTAAFLDRIEKLDPLINSYITVTGEQALRQARRLDRARGRRGPLHGLPLAVKDLCATRGVRTTAGSKILADWVPDFEATAVARWRSVGAVVLGKLNLHEFAYGVSTDNPHHGATCNPWALDRIPGGSSGGSGAAVAASLCAGAIGTDTGGSIRIPAGACGVVGLKPTWGRVSRYGVVPLSWSLDHVGPLAKTVEDAALLLAAMAGADDHDPTCSTRRVGNYRAALRQPAQGLRVGVPREFFFDVVGDEVQAAFDAALTTLKRLGVRALPVSLPSLLQAQPAHLAIMMAEASAYHAVNLTRRADDFGADVRTFLEVGRLIPATAMIAAQRLRARLAAECTAAFARVDALVVPGIAVPAPRRSDTFVNIGNQALDVGSALSRNMGPFNLTGLPAISVPCGQARTGLPLAFQIAGPAFAESTILRLAHAYEQATEWHTLRPPLK
ncbi:MAG: Asp-tRNA(Asn)/Glu-tRNA(Gln) amidotransferase subunit GatA [Deltaproteobacteria bacterium]|nr:Asp-tRNA(Asn)/Glu-tRNA(Gln) amidotransferase subunit GatA [Deltaproteobacteria bacterium]